MESENHSKRTYLKHIGLFLLTLLTTTLAGAEWQYGRNFIYGENTLGWSEFLDGFHYSIPFLLILTVHEFGHYFTARYYKLDVTLPFYIPFWLSFLQIFSTIGTMGAVIRIKTPIDSRKVFFDVGVAGPIAGFVMALLVLYYGFTHLPTAEHIFTIHPEYAQYGLDYAKYVYKNQEETIGMGTSLLFEFFKTYVATDPNLVPNQYEIMHYPYLLAGYLALFFTALNLMPIGQLDGGHVMYGLLGATWHRRLSLAFFYGFIFYAGLGMFSAHDELESLFYYVPFYLFFLYLCFRRAFESALTVCVVAMSIFTLQFATTTMFPEVMGYQGWLLFGLILGRVLGIQHPQTTENDPLSLGRKLIGWLSMLIFILCFSPQPFIFG